ncbi:MAG: response regulator [Oligoflexales bacterium]
MISKPYSVLIVDDMPEMCELIHSELTHQFRSELNLFSTASSQEAIEMIEKEKFDIVLTDLTMPKYSGYDIAKKAWRIGQSTQVIFFTGHGKKSVFSACFREGASAILFKPIVLYDLTKVVRMSIERLDHWSYTYDHKL